MLQLLLNLRSQEIKGKNYVVRKNEENRSNIYTWTLSITKLVFSKLLLKYFEIRFLQKIETTSYAIFA